MVKIESKTEGKDCYKCNHRTMYELYHVLLKYYKFFGKEHVSNFAKLCVYYKDN